MTNGWLMDIDDAIMVLDNEKECVRAANYCDKDCRKCELVLPDVVILTAYEMAKEALRFMAAKDAYAADVATVRHGRWLDAEYEHVNTGEIRLGRRCSECGAGYFRYDVSVNTVSDIPRYCPNCGAKMEQKTGKGEEQI